jgi:hypothetical protein
MTGSDRGDEHSGSGEVGGVSSRFCTGSLNLIRAMSYICDRLDEALA